MRLRVKVELVGDDGQVVSEQAVVATVPKALAESVSADDLALAAAVRAMGMSEAVVGGRVWSDTEAVQQAGGQLQVRRQIRERAARPPVVETRRPVPAGGNDEASIMAEVFAYEQNAGSGGGARRATAQTPQVQPKAPPTAHSAIEAMRRAAAGAPVGPVPSVYSDGDDEVLPWPNQGDPGAAELAEGIALAMRV